jgi:hypothetical protein
VEPFLAFVPPAGVCESTMPFFDLLVTVWVLTLTLNPAAPKLLLAAASGWPVTPGTVAIVG